MTQQFDALGNVLAGGKLYIIQAGTVSTPQIAYQDSALTIPVAGGSIITLDAAGRLPQFFLADGSIKIRLTNAAGVNQVTADGILVVGASSGGGGGSPVDPTTVIQTGWLQAIYGTGVITGFVRGNGRTLGNASSGATERANADTLALFTFLYLQDANLAVSGGRGASAAADYAANKTIALPDWRGKAMAFLDDMGNSAASILTATYFNGSALPTVLGAYGGSQAKNVSINNINAFTPTVNTHALSAAVGVQGTLNIGPGGSTTTTAFPLGNNTTGASQLNAVVNGTITMNSLGAGQPLSVVPPMMLATLYIKL
jgi:hypothetical protein